MDLPAMDLLALKEVVAGEGIVRADPERGGRLTIGMTVTWQKREGHPTRPTRQDRRAQIPSRHQMTPSG
jgi:hypothetical protein